MSDIVHAQVVDFPYNMTTTVFQIPGYRIVESQGVCRRLVVP